MYMKIKVSFYGVLNIDVVYFMTCLKELIWTVALLYE